MSLAWGFYWNKYKGEICAQDADCDQVYWLHKALLCSSLHVE